MSRDVVTSDVGTGLMEWKVNRRVAQMALQAEFTDSVPVTAHVTSFSSGEVFAANLLKSRSAAAHQ